MSINRTWDCIRKGKSDIKLGSVWAWLLPEKSPWGYIETSGTPGTFDTVKGLLSSINTPKNDCFLELPVSVFCFTLWFQTPLLLKDDLLHFESTFFKKANLFCLWDKVSFHLWSISALANSPADHFSRRQRYHQCPDLDQTFSKGWGTSLLKLSNKSTFSARRKDKTYKC